jgi:sugar phosphate isomerase/epimerase
MTATNRAMGRRSALKMAGLSAIGLSLLNIPALAEEAARPRELTLGVASYSLNKLTVAGVIALLKQLQIDRVSLYKTHCPWTTGTPETCREIVRKFSDAGISVTSTGVIDLTKDEAANRVAFANVRAAGLPMLCGRPALDALPLVEKLVKEYDIKVAIHNHGPGDLFPTGEDAWKVIQNYDKRIGLCLDVGHAFRAGGDPVTNIHKCHERLYEVHLKDTKGPKGGNTKDPGPVVVGRGTMGIKAILSALLEVNYSGSVEFEYEEKTDDKIPGLAESIGYVRGMLSALKTQPSGS